MNYKELLDQWYRESIEEDCCPPECKMEFLGSTVFDFTTYDSAMDVLLAGKMIEVVRCIVNGTTFDYIELDYCNYITMVNMPFLADKLEWGTSIRGAWFDGGKSYSINYTEVTDIENFMAQLLEWAVE